jgi:hypothetical protein
LGTWARIWSSEEDTRPLAGVKGAESLLGVDETLTPPITLALAGDVMTGRGMIRCCSVRGIRLCTNRG